MNFQGVAYRLRLIAEAQYPRNSPRFLAPRHGGRHVQRHLEGFVRRCYGRI